jgi:hypothetical protein
MLQQNRPRPPGEAVLKYLDGRYEVVAEGDFVTCAVSGMRISLAALRYWSVDRQEPYATAALALTYLTKMEFP